MGIKHSIEISLFAQYNQANITTILQKGMDLGLVYYDHVAAENYEDSPVLNASQAALKVAHALKEKIEEGPAVFAKIEETYGFLFFYNENGQISFSFGTFGSPIKKDFKDGFYYIDLDHYIRMALDMCKDFAILKLETDSF
jgi:hypothetical protein